MIPWNRVWTGDFTLSLGNVLKPYLVYSLEGNSDDLTDNAAGLAYWLRDFLLTKYYDYNTLYEDIEDVRIRVIRLIKVNIQSVVIEYAKYHSILTNFKNVEGLASTDSVYKQEYESGYKGYSGVDGTFQKNKNLSTSQKKQPLLDVALTTQAMRLVELEQLCKDLENYILQLIY